MCIKKKAAESIRVDESPMKGLTQPTQKPDDSEKRSAHRKSQKPKTNRQGPVVKSLKSDKKYSTKEIHQQVVKAKHHDNNSDNTITDIPEEMPEVELELMNQREQRYTDNDLL